MYSIFHIDDILLFKTDADNFSYKLILKESYILNKTRWISFFLQIEIFEVNTNCFWFGYIENAKRDENVNTFVWFRPPIAWVITDQIFIYMHRLSM